jgi:chromosome segregation ATPase
LPPRSRGQEPKTQTNLTSPSAAVASGDSNGAEVRKLEGKLKAMRIMLIANLAILAVLLVLVFRLSQQLAENRDELKELRMQAQTAMGQLTPSLDARLNVFEKRMDSVDGKMKTAEDRMVTSMDAKMKTAEDRMVERMNAEIPAMLDKYINRKLTEVKH